MKKYRNVAPSFCDPKWKEHLKHTDWVINYILLNLEHYLNMCTCGYVCAMGVVIEIAESHLWEQGSRVNDCHH